MTKFKFLTIILLVLTLFFIIIHLVNKIKEDKLYLQSNLSEYIYTNTLENSFYIKNEKKINLFNPKIPIEFDFIFQEIKQKDIELCLSKYTGEIYVLQLKIDTKHFNLFIKKYHKEIITKVDNKETIYIIENTKDKCIFASYRSGILTFSTSYSLLKNIIKESENIGKKEINSLLLQTWINWPNELKIYNNDMTGEFIANFNDFGSFVLAEYTLTNVLISPKVDSLGMIRENSFIRKEASIYDIDSIDKKLIFKIK